MKKILCFFMIILLCFITTSCMGGVSTGVSDVKYETKPDGSVDIIFFDSYGYEVNRVTIPAAKPGEIGKDGNGIASFNQKLSEDGRSLHVTVEFTDPEMEPLEFDIQNGVSVIGCQRVDEELTGEAQLLLELSDGSFIGPIDMPRGPKGNGIDKFEYILNDDKSVSILISFDNETITPDVNIDIPAPQDGNGIESVNSSIEGDYYILTIKYTQQVEPQIIKFEKPKDPNAWHTGYEQPQKTFGNIGDFFFDITNDTIYFKDASYGWISIVDFGSEEVTYYITFDLNDSTEERASLGGKPNLYTVKRGSYFTSNGNPEIPVPTRTGYVFKGWYTSKYPTVINSPFTDLTAIFSDLTLYACWEKVE